MRGKGRKIHGENPGQTGDYLVFVYKNQVITGLTRIFPMDFPPLSPKQSGGNKN
jgi:hypothetical protein